MSDSLGHRGPWPTRLLCPWDSPGKNTGVGCHALLQGKLPNPGIKPESLVSAWSRGMELGEVIQFLLLSPETHHSQLSQPLRDSGVLIRKM